MADGAYISEYPLETVGATFSEGFQVLRTTKSVTIESVVVKGGSQAIDYLGARIGLPGRPTGFNQFMDAFPPDDVPAALQVPAEGTRLEAGEGYMLILGYRVVELVMDLRDSVTVRYKTDDGERFERKYQAKIVTCPPALAHGEDCYAAAEEKYGREALLRPPA
jgi:hypothetical protein